VNPRETELLEGMGNCYRACGENFDETVRMVAEARDLRPEDVRQTLTEIRERYGNDESYQRLRRRLPEDFPF
jgi:transposase